MPQPAVELAIIDIDDHRRRQPADAVLEERPQAADVSGLKTPSSRLPADAFRRWRTLSADEIELTAVSSVATVIAVRSTGTVLIWRREEGWGVIDCPDTPGGCFVHFSHLWSDKVPKARPGEAIAVSGGFRELFEGETVDFDWEHANQERPRWVPLTR
jgi:cold shock CspA family protein